MKLHTIDVWVLVAYVAAILTFGLWIGRRNKSAVDFALGGRNLPWWALLFSIVATETSTVTFLSVPGIAYTSDLRFLQLPIGFAIGRLLVVWLLLPGYFRGKLFTAYEVLGKRFGGPTKKVASLLFLITRTLGDGLRLYLTALVLWKVTGISQAQAILCIGALTLIYTVVGGMRAVVWTDCIQFLVYMIGAGIALWVLIDQTSGGIEGITRVANAHHKLEVFDFSIDLSEQYTLWAGVFGGAFVSLGSHGADQMMVQRYLCAKSQRQAGIALALSGPIVFAQFALFLLIGTALFGFYYQHHPNITFGGADEAFARFIVTDLPGYVAPGVVGIVLGAVFSAAMSTLSSSLHSSATALVKDLGIPFRNELTGLRLGTVLFGLLQVGVALQATALTEKSPIVGQVLAIQSFTTGVLLGVFFLAIFRRRATGRAAVAALVGGLALMTYLAFWTSLAWPWFAVIGSLATFLVGVLCSALK